MALLNHAFETTNTSGTGTYTLAGAVSPFDTFVSRAGEDIGGSSPWSGVYYVCTDNSGAWEFGSGVLTDAGGGTHTQTRADIHASSNAGAAVNWPDTSAKDIYSWAPGSVITGIVQQVVVAQDATDRQITANILDDNSIPLSSEGTQIISASITPTNSSNTIKVTVSIPVCDAQTTNAVVSAFTGTTCIGAGLVQQDDNSFHAVWYYTAGGTSAQTVSVRGGDTGAGNFWINRDRSTADVFSTAAAVTLVIEEIAI
jgi:hypothetical protein